MTAVPHMGARRSSRSLRRPRTTHHVRTGVMSSGAFAIGAVVVMSLGLLTLLVLNTALAKGSFRVHELLVEQADMTQRGQMLERQISEASAPNALTLRARALGMIPAANPVFVSLEKGKIVGEPFAAGTDPLADVPGAEPLDGLQPTDPDAAAIEAEQEAAAEESATDTGSLPAEGPAEPVPGGQPGTTGTSEQPLGMTKGTVDQ